MKNTYFFLLFSHFPHDTLTTKLTMTLWSRLLRALLSHELVKKGWTAYSWRDNFSRDTNISFIAPSI